LLKEFLGEDFPGCSDGRLGVICGDLVIELLEFFLPSPFEGL